MMMMMLLLLLLQLRNKDLHSRSLFLQHGFPLRLSTLELRLVKAVEGDIFQPYSLFYKWNFKIEVALTAKR